MARPLCMALAVVIYVPSLSRYNKDEKRRMKNESMNKEE
jgi:cellobiose-specific phosphotransferase system component IIC